MKRSVGFVLGILLLATCVAAVAVLVLYLAVGREPAVAARSTLVLRPTGSLPEVLPDLSFGASNELTIRAYVELIRKAKADRRIAGILLKPGTLDSPFWAKIQELREALADFKQSGKYQCTRISNTPAIASTSWPRSPIACSCCHRPPST